PGRERWGHGNQGSQSHAKERSVREHIDHVGAPPLVKRVLPSVQWSQTLERNEDETGDHDGPDVEQCKGYVEEIHVSRCVSPSLSEGGRSLALTGPMTV